MTTLPDTIEACHLPESLRELAELMGIGPVLALVGQYGGRDHLQVPRHAKPDHKLTKLIGQEAADKLCEYWGGDRLYIPKADVAMRCIRDQDIVRRYDEGERVNDLAAEYGITARRVWDILKQPTQQEQQKQPTLF